MQFLTNSQVAVLPMFLMMGSFAVVAGLSGDIYELAHTLLSHRRGGLALATIAGCGGFGALTGSSLATVATIGRVALPEMRVARLFGEPGNRLHRGGRNARRAGPAVDPADFLRAAD